MVLSIASATTWTLEAHGAQEITATIGGSEIEVVGPDQFFEVSELLPKYREFAERVTPAENRVIAVFLDREGIEAMARGQYTQPLANASLQTLSLIHI